MGKYDLLAKYLSSCNKESYFKYERNRGYYR